jgi:hypothetical protein
MARADAVSASSVRKVDPRGFISSSPVCLAMM